MRAPKKLAALVLAAGVTLALGAAIAPAANAATLKPMTPEQAHAMGWHLLIPTIEGPCTRYFLSTDKKFLVSQRSTVPNDQCPADDYQSSHSALGTMTVSKILRNDGGAPGLQGLVLTPKTYTAPFWKKLVLNQLKPSAQTLSEVMSLSRPYLKK